jgi:hypothetical protein
MTTPIFEDALPGHDLVAAGVADLERGVESVPALLASIGAPDSKRSGSRCPRSSPTPSIGSTNSCTATIRTRRTTATTPWYAGS